jgi:hypothetical protein
MKLRNNYIDFLVLLLSAQAAFGSLELVINPIGQDQTLWCWAACCEMIFDAYQISPSIDQYDVADWAVDGNNDSNNLSGDSYSVDQVLWYFGSIYSNYTKKPSSGQGNISKYDLSYEIDYGRPIIAAMAVDNGDGSGAYLHDVLIRGYEGASGSNMTYVIYNDPADGGSRQRLSYAEFVRTGNSWAWYETLRLTTDPDYPIPTPIGGSNWVQVNTGGTTVVTPTTSSLSYSASSCCKSITWNWNLIFTDVNGPVVVASGTRPTDNSYTTTWNITNFAMPAGHQWYYNYNGKIPGRVELSATIESEQIYDGKDVIFVPSVLYPGYIVFANQTVSSSHADVKAHTSVSLTNDAITSTGNVSFKAGNKIDINDGVTIQNGSLTNFIIDPGLQ